MSFLWAKVSIILIAIAITACSTVQAQKEPLSIEKINPQLDLYTTYNTFEGKWLFPDMTHGRTISK